jgi:hypothetical protein
MDIDRVEATTVNEAIDAVLGFSDATREGQTVWFRGSHCCHHKLIPSLMRRPGITPETMFELESRLITLYRQRSLPFWPEGYPQTDWEHMFSMQHHGIETRLLDWSENAFVGLWFAFDGECPADDHECWPALWLLDPQELNRISLSHIHEQDSPVPILTTVDEDLKPYAPATVLPPPRRIKSAVALYGTHNSPRISAQRGVFTVAGKDITAIEDSIGGEAGRGFPVLRIVDLKGDIEKLRAQMSMLGFSTSMVYPDLPGLARDLAEMTKGL